MMKHYDILVVGAGHGGAQAAIALRQQGFAGTLAVLGAERFHPYERPPLSKDYLSGDRPFERLLIRPVSFWEDRSVDFLLNHAVVAVDPARHVVQTADGQDLAYGTLIWAAGGEARSLTCSGHNLQRVHRVRNLADVDQMISELPQTQRVVVVGGGFIGLEAAAVLAKLGREVIVLEAQDRLLARVAGEPISRFYAAQHRAHGVDVRLGVNVEAIEGVGGLATGVRLANGTLVASDMVIVGIGITPAVQPLLAAGLAAGSGQAGGVMVDEFCRTSDPDIYAVGDCAAHANAFANGGSIRLESVQNANDQATTAAKAICGVPVPYQSVPWFWSNQYDLKLQTIGLSIGYDELVVRGSLADRSFSVVYLRDGRVIALDCVNAVKDFVQGKALVTSRVRVETGVLADVSVPFKEIVGRGLRSSDGGTAP